MNKQIKINSKNIKKSSLPEKSLFEVMSNAYDIAERSGFYFPYRKYDWLESNTD